MSTENSAGKKDPATQPIVAANTSRAGMGGAITAVANAPLQIFTYSSGGKGKV